MKKLISFLSIALISFSSGALAFNSDEVIAKITSLNFTVNGQQKQADDEILNVNGKSYLPVRSIANLLGYSVSFDGSTQTVGFSNQPKSNSQTSTIPNETQTQKNSTDNNNKNQETKMLKIGETFDNGKAKITVFDLKQLRKGDPQFIPFNDTSISKVYEYKLKIELNKDTAIRDYTINYTTDNPRYNEGIAKLSDYATVFIDYGESKTIPYQLVERSNYKFTNISLSIPTIGVDNVTWKIDK
jgi:hypothetical protein